MDNSWISENRQLSYTKTPTSMPDSPYRVERLQGKECDVMPQTLAEVVFMPDGSSVADRLGGATLEGAALGTFTSSVACHSRRMWYGLYTEEKGPIVFRRLPCYIQKYEPKFPQGVTEVSMLHGMVAPT